MKNLTEGNIYKTFLLFAIPLILAGLLSQSYNIIDTMIAGKFLGADGLAAVGATSAFITFCSSILWGFGNGATIYIARLFGGKDYKKVKSAVYNNMFLLIGIAAAISIISIVFSDGILSLLNVDKSILIGTKAYFQVYFAGFSFILLNAYCVFVLQAFGSSTFSFYMSIISTILNICINILMVVVLKSGPEGLAIGSVVAAFVVDIFYLLKIKKCIIQLNVGGYKVKPDLKIIKNTFKFSFPVTVQQSVMYVSSMLISPIVNGIGSSATAAYTVVMKIYDINAMLYQESGKTLGAYTAQSVGAKKPENLKKGLKVGLLQGILFVSPLLLSCVIFAEKAALMFFPKDYTGEGFMYAVIFIRYYLPLVLFNLVNNLFHNFYRGTGCMKMLVYATFLGSVSKYIITLILVNFYAMNGVFMGWVASWIIEALFSLFIYFSGRWKKYAAL